MQRINILLLTIAIVLVYTTPLWAQTLTGKVIGIADGDTFTLLTEQKEQKKIRLAEIDCPESGQPYGKRAKEILSQLIFSKEVRVVQTDLDHYGRIVARVYQGPTDINAEMIRQGAAWVYREYARDQTLYALEDEAKAAQTGLWSLPVAQQVPPWKWRRIGVKTSNPAEKTNASDQEFTCGSKRYCKEMSSCEEARFYLEECGLTRLDGDGDGIPCENLCE
jgi:endonuclease YncB( thermonuclease family)